MSVVIYNYPAKWTGANPNPIFYSIQDDENDIVIFDLSSESVVNSLGKVRINLTNECFFTNDYVEILGTIYAGIHKIVVAKDNYIILDLEFRNLLSQNLGIKTYQFNKFLLTNIFTGFPQNHIQQKPYKLTDIQKSRFFQNICFVDVAPACRSNFNISPYPSQIIGNDYLLKGFNNQISYYAEFGKSYDVWFNGKPYTNYASLERLGSFELGTNLIQNSDFQQQPPIDNFWKEDFVFGGSTWNLGDFNIPTSNLLTYGNTAQIYQNVELEKNENYFIRITIDTSVYGKKNILINDILTFQSIEPAGQTFSFTYKADYTGLHKIGFLVSEVLSNYEFSILSFFVFKKNYDEPTKWAINATKQNTQNFEYSDYLWANDETAKFLSLYQTKDKIMAFADNECNVSLIVDSEVFKIFGSEGFPENDYTFNIDNEGIYHIRMNYFYNNNGGSSFLRLVKNNDTEYQFEINLQIINKKQCNVEINLQIFNYLGGFDYWTFEGLALDKYEMENGEALVKDRYFNLNNPTQNTFVSKVGKNTKTITTRTTKEYAQPLLEWLHRAIKVFNQKNAKEVLISKDAQSYRERENIVIIETSYTESYDTLIQKL